jgi:hypothetical protein
MTFGKRKLPPPGATPLFGEKPLLPIYLRQRHLDLPEELVQDNVDFVETALKEALFKRDEFPVEAMQSYHVHYYLKLTQAGGHGYFLHESRWAEAIVNDIMAGLERMELVEPLRLFRDLASYARQAPDRFLLAVERGRLQPPYPVIKALDERFNAGSESSILEGNAAFLRSLGCVEALADADYDRTMADLPARNAHYAARRRDLDRLSADQRERVDPLLQGLAYVCSQSRPWPVEFLSLKATDPASDPQTGEAGVLFWIETNAGGGRIIAFSRNCYLYLGQEQDPRVVMPVAALEDVVRRRTGGSFTDSLRARQTPAGGAPHLIESTRA